MLDLTDRDVVAATLQKIVDEKGADYVYPRAGTSCHYADPDTGEPSCIVGHLIHALDPETFAEVREREAVYASFAVENLSDYVEGARYDPDVLEALNDAQAWQDIGYTWGEALVKFQTSILRAES